MTWYVQFKMDGTAEVAPFPTAEQAIREACRLVHQGIDVLTIGTRPYGETVDRAAVQRLCDVWKVARPPNNLTKPEHYRKEAARARRWAANTTDRAVERQMNDIADSYETLARELEVHEHAAGG